MWLCTILSIVFIVSRAVEKEENLFYVHHEEGFDLFIFLFVLVQMMIRASAIAVKYATLSDGKYRLFHETRLTKEEALGEQMMTSWVTMTPDSILEEVTLSLVRKDVEPSLVNFQSFNDMGGIVKSKFTYPGFYDHRYDDKDRRIHKIKKYEYAEARQECLSHDKAFKLVRDTVLRGEHNKSKVFFVL
jgi:hypothetical protein